MKARRAATTSYRAGCGRSWQVQADAPDLAYTRLEFPECPACPHRAEPQGGPPFCTLRPTGAAHPFAALAELELPE